MPHIIGIDLSSAGCRAAEMNGGRAELIPGAALAVPAGSAQALPILQARLRDARSHIGQAAFGAVIAVPGTYTAADRAAVLDAARKLGLSPVRVIGSSAAAALDYLFRHRDADGFFATVLLSDTACEVSVVNLGDMVADTAALAVSGQAVSFTPSGALSPASAERLTALVKQALADAEVTPAQLWGFIPVCEPRYLLPLTDVMHPFTGCCPVSADTRTAAARGAAVLSGSLSGGEAALVVETLSYSLGIETMGGIFTRIIKRNTSIPTRKSQIFSTAVDDQNSVEVHVLQGESEQAAQNADLGRFMMNGIAPAPKGVPQIEVTFDIDFDGVLTVTARDVTGGGDRPLSVSSRLSAQPAPKKQPEQPKQSAPPPPPPPKPQAPGTDGRMDAVLKLLPVYDSLARAVQFEPDPLKRQGSEAILNQYKTILADMGVQVIRTVGCTFDPHLHDAREHVSDPGRGAGEIVRELEAGFIMDGKVLRFAKVVVAN